MVNAPACSEAAVAASARFNARNCSGLAAVIGRHVPCVAGHCSCRAGYAPARSRVTPRMCGAAAAVSAAADAPRTSRDQRGGRGGRRRLAPAGGRRARGGSKARLAAACAATRWSPAAGRLPPPDRGPAGIRVAVPWPCRWDAGGGEDVRESRATRLETAAADARAKLGVAFHDAPLLPPPPRTPPTFRLSFAGRRLLRSG
jgi:hypothetical protein